MDGEIDPDDLAGVLDGVDRDPDDEHPAEDGLRIVDIRSRRAFDRGHIPGSECIPFPELTTRVTELAGAERVVTVCPHGISSRQAAQLIGSYVGTQDARVESLRGGIQAWERGPGAMVPTAAEEADDGAAAADDTTEGPDAPF